MEYKYITQEIVDKGTFNATSPEMFREAGEYNMEAVKNYSKRKGMARAANIWIVCQYLYVIIKFISTVYGANNYERLVGHSIRWWQVVLVILGFLGYMGLMGYFAFLKGSRDRFTLCCAALPVILMSPLLFGLPLGNFIVFWIYRYNEEQLSKELGYPAFPRLRITTLASEADDVTSMSYDSIREKIRKDHPDMGDFL